MILWKKKKIDGNGRRDIGSILTTSVLIRTKLVNYALFLDLIEGNKPELHIIFSISTHI